MALDDIGVVDAIGIDKSTGKVVLTIADHLEWGNESDHHLFLLQEKINTYLRFIESGEIFETYPNARDRSIIIDVVYKFPLPKKANLFYARVKEILHSAGVEFADRELTNN